MSVPEIGRTKDVGREVGVPATEPFPRDEVGDDDTTEQATSGPRDQVRDRLDASA